MGNYIIIRSAVYMKIKRIIYKLILFYNNIEFFSTTSIDEKQSIVKNKYAEDILDNYGNNILRLSYSYLHNMSDAEDVLQDTMIKLLKANPKFESPEHEKAWLLRVCVNLSKNRIKYNKIRKTDELNESLIYEDKKDLSFIWSAIKSLPPKYSEVLHLFHYEGYSTVQIAQILNKNESTVRSSLSRGRSKLKDILKEEYYFDEKLW